MNPEKENKSKRLTQKDEETIKHVQLTKELTKNYNLLITPIDKEIQLLCFTHHLNLCKYPNY